MSPAKVTLSPKELELVSDAAWILTKNGIIQKVYTLFGGLSATYEKMIAGSFLSTDETIHTQSPKISKGEQYEGLPWVMLDHPRYYKGGDAFGIRTFFWWGNGFSITLQLSGSYQEKFAERIGHYFQTHAVDNWWIGIGDDPWQHHFRADNYVPLTHEHLSGKKSFIKLAKKFPVGDWDQLPEKLSETMMEIIGMLSPAEDGSGAA